MLIALLIAGIGFLLAGLLGIALGSPEKEFSFGNTEILAGTIAACSGIIMLGLYVVARQLKEIAQLLGSTGAATPRAALPSAPASPALRDQTSENDGLLFNQPGATHPADTEPAPPPSATPPWHEETATRDRVRGDMPQVPPAPGPAPAAKQRRNLLFSSTLRRERERAEGRAADLSMAGPPPVPAVAPSPARLNEPPSATFDDAWPQLGRGRTPDAPPRRSSRTPSAFAEEDAAGADHELPAPFSDEPPAVTVLKSGVVDGMAYSLYSDGSIEAQLPEGMMRFASIDALRTHLDQRG
jgi:hypothetical protein